MSDTGDQSELVDITITAGDEEWLAGFTRRLVEDRLVACGNIVPVRSIYAWESHVEDEPESLVVLHTRRALVERVLERVRSEHPYDVPQVLVLPVVDADARYRAWLTGWTTALG